MSEQTGAMIALNIQAGGQTLWAQPRPDDEGRLKELLGERQVTISLDESGDTQGHMASNEVTLDVEGHAIAVRFPTAADAATVRRAFALGVVTASLVMGGAAAAVAGAGLIASQAAAPAVPAAEAQEPSSDTHPLHRPAPIQRE